MLSDEDKKVIEWFEQEHKDSINMGDEDDEAKVILSEYGMTVLTHKDILDHMKRETDIGREEIEELKKHLREEGKI